MRHASVVFIAFVALSITSCSGLPEGAEPLRPGDMQSGSSGGSGEGSEATANADEDGSTKKAGSAAAGSADGLLDPYRSLSCPTLEAPPENLDTPEEIREWGCQKLVGDLDQPEKLGTEHLGDKMLACAESEGSSMTFYCWSAEGEELARFGDLGEEGFESVRVAHSESASKIVDGASLVVRRATLCQFEFDSEEQNDFITIKHDGTVDSATFRMLNEQGQLVERKSYSGATGKVQTEERREWDGTNFKAYSPTDSGEELVSTGEADSEGRDIRVVDAKTKAVAEYAFAEAGQTLTRRDSDADGKWEMIEKTTYDDEGRTIRIERTQPGQQPTTTVFEYGPHGVTRAVQTSGGEETIVQKVTYDSQGRPTESRRLWPISLSVATHEWNAANRAKTVQSDYRFAPGAEVGIDDEPEGSSRDREIERWFGCYLK